ncbi:MAG: response regulator [Planctomycetales bacterium]|nr:response regulator [Planctomycetales bacterium]
MRDNRVELRKLFKHDDVLPQLFLPVAVIVLCLSIVIVYAETHRLTQSHIKATALHDVRAYNTAVAELCSLYVTEVIDRLPPDTLVTNDYMHHSGAIPSPATLTKVLGERLRAQHQKTTTHLYSDYPFIDSKRSHSLDQFERDALVHLRKYPSEPYYRFDNSHGIPRVRFATSDVMTESCVACHNSHPKSPKRDWKVGDVRGVLSTTMTLDSVQAESKRLTMRLILALGFVGGSVVGLFSVTLVLLRRRAVALDDSNANLLQERAALEEARGQLQESNQILRVYASKLNRSRRAAYNLMHDMNDAKERAERNNLAKSRFLANMSHELRMPLTAILGFSDSMDASRSQHEQLQAFKTIHRNGSRLLTLIDDILVLAKIEAGKLSLDQIECRLDALLLDIRRQMQARADEKEIEWKVEIEGSVPAIIKTDPTRLRQLLTNLVTNSIRSTSTGFVRLIVSVQDDYLQFRIVDSGVGLNEQQLTRVFDPFTREDKTKEREHTGTGLELAISKQIAVLLEGDITATSKSEEGTEFLAKIHLQQMGNACFSSLPDYDDSSIEYTEPKAQLNGIRVLIVEDGFDNQRLIRFVLEKAGADVTVAPNGKVGSELAIDQWQNHTPFEVVLMDMQMPVMDGYTASRRLREQNYSNPIIALTAATTPGERADCLAAGCNDYASKPIERERLLRLVAHYGRNAQLALAELCESSPRVQEVHAPTM